MGNRVHQADSLRNLGEIHSPDERCSAHSRYDEAGLRANTLDDHYTDIAQFQLSDTVPIDVAVLYETAKNLYLYSWHVYRFYSVAEHQVLACLEMGLRVRFPGGLPIGYPFKKHPNLRPTLAPLLRYAIDQELIRNEGFSRWHNLVQQRARNRAMHEQIAEMERTNSTFAEIRFDEVVPNTQDRSCEFVSTLDEILPGIRNSYAHGSFRLSNQVLGTFELVREILEQIYPSEKIRRSLQR